MITLTDLFCHANIGTYTQHTWFLGALWHPPILFVNPAFDGLAFIEKHYASAFRELVPSLELRPLAPQPKAVKAKPSLWKKGYEPVRDLLD